MPNSKKVRQTAAWIANNRKVALAWHHAHKKDPKKRFSKYKYGAKLRDLNFSLTKEEFMTFWQVPCFYCGDSIETIGLDRMDSSKGYTLDNVVSCCFPCNEFKRRRDYSQFVTICIKIGNHLSGLG